ncbi:MAG TPA: ABC transporter substrate-binding protein [Vicinamibacterales bacterium]|nr:ABC transporter substrate-binding protein [Vicinamibacterales bacterium]
MRSEPRSFNRLVTGTQSADLLSILMQARLLRVNKATFELEPMLAENWESSADGLVHTLHLRKGVAWSDGTPFTSADVVFSLAAAMDPKAGSVLTSVLVAGGKPIAVNAPGLDTVTLTFAGTSGLGLRMLDQVAILPKHKLEAVYAKGEFAKAWSAATPPSELAGLGPFVLKEYTPGQRLVFDRNPRYWRKAPNGDALPYVDRVVLEIVPDQNAELLRLQSGATDLTQDALRPDDYVPVKRLEQQGTLKMEEIGVATDADGLWFCLKPEARRRDPRWAFVQRREFRQALSHAVDREAFAQSVFLGEAVPVWGPVTPGNKEWFSPNVPRYPYDESTAKALLKSIGLEDRNGNGVVEDAKGTEARFTLITQKGLTWYERGTSVIREAAAKVGVAFEIAPLEVGAMVKRLQVCDYDAIYMRVLWTDVDPAGNMDFWVSSGEGHPWNIASKTPATEWESRVDQLMAQQAATTDATQRHALFNDVQKVMGENVPALYFAAPRLYAAHSTRVRGAIPSVVRPHLLWNVDMLSVSK